MWVFSILMSGVFMALTHSAIKDWRRAKTGSRHRARYIRWICVNSLFAAYFAIAALGAFVG